MTYLDYLRNQQLRKKKSKANKTSKTHDSANDADAQSEKNTEQQDDSDGISFTDNDDITKINDDDIETVELEDSNTNEEQTESAQDNPTQASSEQDDTGSEEETQKDETVVDEHDNPTDAEITKNSSEIHEEPANNDDNHKNENIIADSTESNAENHPITDDNPVPLNTALVIVDVQNGFMNENTDYIPGAINDFIRDNKEWFSEIIRMKLTGGDAGVYPDDRSGKAGPARALRNSFQSRFTSPINKLHGVTIKHKNSTDVSELIDYINSHNIQHVYICGLETDVILYPMISCLRNANIDVSVIYDLTATAIGAYIQLALKPALEHLLGREHVIEASIPDTTPMEKSDERIKNDNKMDNE